MKSKFLKTIGSLLMVGALAVTFAACGGGEKPSNTPGKKTHDQTTHVVTGSDKTLHHNFVDGKCTMCDETTIFMQEAVYKSMKNVLDNAQAQQGTLESVWYKTRAYGVEKKFEGKKDVNGKDYDGSPLWIYKRAWVYLPYGYNKEDTSKKYNARQRPQRGLLVCRRFL